MMVIGHLEESKDDGSRSRSWMGGMNSMERPSKG